MNDIEAFNKTYPLTLLDGVFTVCIARYGWLPFDPELPLPSVKGIKPFIRFCGFSDSALRTALSRERRKDNLAFFTDDDGVQRFDMASFGRGLTRFYQKGLPSGEGLTMAVFQFTTGQNKARYALKDILRGFSFEMLTQNTYISREVPHEEIMIAAEEAGVADNVYLFDTDIPAGNTLDKIKDIYSVDSMEQKYLRFKTDLSRYFDTPGDGDSSFCRALYAGAAHHMNNRVLLPPLPESVFSGLRVFLEIDQMITEYFTRNYDRHRSVYLKYHGG